MGKSSAARRVILAAAFFFLLIPAHVHAEECKFDSVWLRGDWGEAIFSVEIADDDAERSRGLMFRETMPRMSGMLFVYPRPQIARFWMKNTYISLDMLFADESGTVTKIHQEAQPESLRLIRGGEGIQYVLEINGGLSEALGIEEGSVLRHPAISQDIAAWPC